MSTRITAKVAGFHALSEDITGRRKRRHPNAGRSVFHPAAFPCFLLYVSKIKSESSIDDYFIKPVSQATTDGFTPVSLNPLNEVYR